MTSMYKSLITYCLLLIMITISEKLFFYNDYMLFISNFVKIERIKLVTNSYIISKVLSAQKTAS